MRSALKLGWCPVLVLLGACSPAVVAQVDEAAPIARPEVLSPRGGQRIGEADDPLCPTSEKACYKIRAQGRVPDGLTPFFGVEPVMESPTIWIQPAIHGVGGDGTFAGLIYLGEAHNGAAAHFKIYVLACEDEERLSGGDRIQKLPKECLASEPVEVYRVR